MLKVLSIFLKEYMQEEFEDTKGVIRIRKSKDRQHNDQKKKDKRTNNVITVKINKQTKHSDERSTRSYINTSTI
jgi:hypothetical protein